MNFIAEMRDYLKTDSWLHTHTKPGLEVTVLRVNTTSEPVNNKSGSDNVYVSGNRPG